MADCGVYAITSPSGKQYVGSAVNMRQRWSRHRGRLSRGSHGNDRLQAAWEKHGANGFTFTRLLICSREDLLFYEQRAIDVLQPRYNVLSLAGSSLGYRHTVKTRSKMSRSSRGVPKSAEHRAKISAALKGKPNGQKGMKRSAKGCANISASLMGHPGFMKGKKHTAEAKRKISEALIGKRQSPERRARNAAAQIGKVLSTEHRAAIAAGNKGKRRSEEQRQRYSAAAFLRWKRQHAAE